MVPILALSTPLCIIITGGNAKHYIGDLIVVTIAIFIPFSPFVIGSLKNTFREKSEPKFVPKPLPKPVSQPQVVNQVSSTGNNAESIGYWILVIICAIIAFVVIKGFLDWWFGLFGLGIGLIILLLILNL